MDGDATVLRRPHTLALLPGGPRAAVLVSVVALHLRGAVEAGGKDTVEAVPGAGEDVTEPLERAVLEHLTGPGPTAVGPQGPGRPGRGRGPVGRARGGRAHGLRRPREPRGASPGQGPAAAPSAAHRPARPDRRGEAAGRRPARRGGPADGRAALRAPGGPGQACDDEEAPRRLRRQHERERRRREPCDRGPRLRGRRWLRRGRLLSTPPHAGAARPPEGTGRPGPCPRSGARLATPGAEVRPSAS
jgi:hypothetical protein